jgi:hypothetical protein
MVENISAVLDENRHAKLKRAIAHAYAMSSVVDFEPLVDSTSGAFMRAMSERFADTGLECHLDEWLQMYAFDIMSVMSHSHRVRSFADGHSVENSHLASLLDLLKKDTTWKT